MESSLLPIVHKDPIPITKPQIPAKKSNKKTDRQLTHLSQARSLQAAISALEAGSVIRPKTYISLLQSCIDSGSIDSGRRLHSSLGSVLDPTPFVETKLVSMYAKCGTLEEARHVFDGMPHRNLFTWSAMIGGCSREQRWEEVVELFLRMMQEGVVPDAFLIPKILQACSNVGDIETGMLLHSLSVRRGFLTPSSGETRVGNSILALYAKCGELALAKKFFDKLIDRDAVSWNSIISGHCQYGDNEEARMLFEDMVKEGIEPSLVTWNILITSYNQSGNPELAMELMKKMERSGIAADVVTWTSMISGFAQNGRMSEALDLFQEMLLSKVKPNGMTVASVISASADSRNLKKGTEFHSYAVKIRGVASVLVGNSLIDMYSKCGRLEDAQRVFDGIVEKDIFTWNSMIGGYALAGYCGKAYDLFAKMESLGVQRNVVTWNVMISGYIQKGDEDKAMELFERMEEDGIKRNTASWNTLIAGSLQNGLVDKGFRIFRQMQSSLVRPNSVTVLTVLPVCANLVSAWKVKEIHASILHNDLQFATPIMNALIDAYSKSGDVESARTLFDDLESRDLVSWTSMISGYVLHGRSQLALDMFSQMKKKGAKLNHSIFANVIGAYGLEGMVDEGKELFDSMITEHQLSPGLEHYVGMVELFGRPGRLREASDFIENMPMDPDWTVWNTLFTAARIHCNVKVANLAAEHMFKLDPENTRTKRLISTLQTFGAKSSDLSKARKPNRDNGAGDSHNCCWMEVRNKIYKFSTGEQPTRSMEAKLAEINSVKENLHKSRFQETKLDIEEEIEEIGGAHGEKLAIAFGLINMCSFKSIRIIKNVRMCTECHTMAKLVSKAYGCNLLLKDSKCLHRVKDGECSCRDYW